MQQESGKQLKKIIAKYIINDLVNIVLEYTGSHVHLYNFGFREEFKHIINKSIPEVCFLEADVMCMCLINFGSECNIFMNIKNNIGTIQLAKGNMHDNINKINPIKYCPFNKKLYFDFSPMSDNLLIHWIKDPESYLITPKYHGPVLIINKEDYEFTFYNFGRIFYQMILTKKEYDQIINDFISISSFIFSIIKKFGHKPDKIKY
jgi:hypothetical protein